MISYKEFEVLKAIIRDGKKARTTTIKDIVKGALLYNVYHSEEELDSIISSLIKGGYILNGEITNKAISEIEPCKVESAIILAAGASEVSAKSVYSMPKGLFIKNGETLIERQIKQLQEIGIKKISVVVGYKQELYFFLADKYNIDIVVNPDIRKNNIYSLSLVADKLGNSYICNCDNYFETNPFFQYEYNAFHATIQKSNIHNELLVCKNESGRITKVYSGAKDGECIYGHAYIDKAFAERLKRYLKEEIDDFRTTSLFWEEFVAKHIDNLDIYVREYSSNFIYEFDTIQEIQNIDTLFLETVSQRINQTICEVLNCKISDIKNIQILQKGLTNILFTFYVNGIKYIYRYPGESSSFFIYRKNECRAQKLASKAGVDKTYIYIDETGVKISRYVDNCRNLNGIYYNDITMMKALAEKIRIFHKEGMNIPDSKDFEYNPIVECEHYMKEASKAKGNLFELFSNEWSDVKELYSYTERDGIKKTMCHNDINQDNCLLNDNEFDIIDWEFAGFNDPAYDFGRVIAGYDFEDNSIDKILETYFERSATELERLHWIAYVGIHNWYYVGWALYKESINESSRDWMYFFYKQAKRAFAYALPRYREYYGVQ